MGFTFYPSSSVLYSVLHGTTDSNIQSWLESEQASRPSHNIRLPPRFRRGDWTRGPDHDR